MRPAPPENPIGPPFGGGGGGGGSTPPSGGSPQAGSVNIPPSNGGVFAQARAAVFPVFNVNSDMVEFRAYDPTQGFSDPNSVCRYSWRVEQIIPYRQPTIRRLALTYRDLGQVAVTFSITGSNDVGEVVSASTPVGFGSKVPTNRLFTVLVDILLTCQLPQVSVFRDKGAGPLSIVQLVPVGEVEETNL
jgi:hypothetical protein